MLTRRVWVFGGLLFSVVAPGVAAARRSRTPAPDETPAPLRWKVVVDRATYDVTLLDPPNLPPPPATVAIHYQWQEDDRIEAWWQSVVEGDRAPKRIFLYALQGKGKKAVVSYALDGAALTQFKGPALARDGGYSGPSTAVVTFQSVRVLPH